MYWEGRALARSKRLDPEYNFLRVRCRYVLDEYGDGALGNVWSRVLYGVCLLFFDRLLTMLQESGTLCP